MQQSINRLDHVAFLVRRENIPKFKKQLSDTLGVKWDEEVVYEKAGMMVVPSWDAGIELVAPLHESGQLWERIQKFGEGSCTLVFGVRDLDSSVQRVEENGGVFMFNIELDGDEPWLKRFRVFREARVKLFDTEFATGFTLGQIEPS